MPSTLVAVRRGARPVAASKTFDICQARPCAAPSPINTWAPPWCRLSDDLTATCITHNLAIYDRVGQSIERVTKTGHAARLEHPTPMHVFGCGEFDAPCQIEVRWPSGQVQQLDSIPLDQVITIEEAAL